jgi:UDP-N-acetylmuramate: L-alanyl-gamma-D-glutamyl-meso-diaminopimelate ligase
MKVHCVGVGDPELNFLEVALRKLNISVTSSEIDVLSGASNTLKAGILPAELGWFPEKIDKELDFVIISSGMKADNPELKQAQELGLRIVSVCEFLHEFSRHKTRVFIGGSTDSGFIANLVLHVLHYWDKEADFWLGSEMGQSEGPGNLSWENDFLILQADNFTSVLLDNVPGILKYKPNIALLSGILGQNSAEDLTNKFLQTLIPGGSITYNAEDPILENLVNALQTPVRRFPYHSAVFQSSGNSLLIETSEGMLPLRISESQKLQNLDGARWICQQMGVFATEFYEAISGFES